ncbi:YcnI family copper-binding membrane protein [Nocardia higoensis]|uniref:YcnI family copper-binding membrane protein n=1 Tax=Nocardia higoensis TaxID=228599 RepID=UPI000A02C720|nr:YcnI family protein [Nocardia higoensis]
MVDSDSRTPWRRGRFGRFGTAVTAAALAVTAFAAPAAAHVRSDGTPLNQGGFGVVRLIVPGESAGADTVGLSVTLPDGVDLKSARTLPVPGWTATIEREQTGGSERVARIVWTADSPADGFDVTQYREFSFSAGPWPKDESSVALPTDQRYSDGSVVSWNEVAVDAASEPEHPAPVVTLVAAGGHGHDSGHGEGTSNDAADHGTGSGESSPDGWWRALAVVNLVLVLVLGAGLTAVWRRDRGARS